MELILEKKNNINWMDMLNWHLNMTLKGCKNYVKIFTDDQRVSNLVDKLIKKQNKLFNL